MARTFAAFRLSVVVSLLVFCLQPQALGSGHDDDVGHASCDAAASSPSPATPPPPIVVIGSLNVDITVKVARPPRLEETVMATDPGVTLAVGGKGANQAVAAARLSSADRRVKFVCQFGGDAHASMLETELVNNDVDVSLSGHHPNLPSGQGIVLLSPGGEASSVVVGGANIQWPTDEEELRRLVTRAVEGAAVLLLQREVPERVNVAAAAAAVAAGVPIVLDAGGVDTPVPSELLAAVDYLCPNESELSRLTGGMPTNTDDEVVAAAKTLLVAGARRVLVTLGERGAMLITGGDGGDGGVGGGGGGEVRNTKRDVTVTVTWHPPIDVPGGEVVDGTAAGDAFRAGLAVALAEGDRRRGAPMENGLRLAAAAGAAAVSVAGAMPSLPTRAVAEALLPPEERSQSQQPPSAAAAAAADNNKNGPSTCVGARKEKKEKEDETEEEEEECPLRFGSRLNSMKARPELWKKSSARRSDDNDADSSSSLSWWESLFGSYWKRKKQADDDGGEGSMRVLDMVRRLGTADGINLVDFNYPQHLDGLKPATVAATLAESNLAAGAVAVRFPASTYRDGGAFTNPDPSIRFKAVDVVAGACKWAETLFASGGVVIWPQFDGYDYHLQVNHTDSWYVPGFSQGFPMLSRNTTNQGSISFLFVHRASS